MTIINRLKEQYPIIVLLIIGAIARFYRLGFQSVWLDEIHTLNEADPSLSWSAFYNSLMTSEPHPPLYFALVRVMFMIFGHSAITLRIFSALIGVAGIYALYVLAKEMAGKRTGLIAAALLCVNYFHIYYSQEGRPYIFLTLFTTLSFWRLLVFLKAPNHRNAIFYGVFSALMIYGHFFGLFALASQYFLLLFFWILSNEKKRFVLLSLLSGVIALLLYLPALPLFKKSMEITDFWIPAPTPDIYTSFVKEFFGNSEIVVAIAGILLIVYFISLSRAKDTAISYNGIATNKPVLNFIILLSWITIVIYIPLVRSYVSIPMLISRYFIVVLPAIIIMLALGISAFRNKTVQLGVLMVFLVFAMTDVIVVKRYYKQPMKSQFREASAFIKSNNKSGDPVISRLAWYMRYFFKDKADHFETADKPLDQYINEMQQDSTKIKPFWYIDGHEATYAPTGNTLDFINKHFYIENNYDGFQAWTKHFVLLKDMPKMLDISKYPDPKPYNGDGFMYNIEAFEFQNNIVKTSGWAFFEKQVATNSNLDVVMVKDGQAYRLQIQKVNRPDNTTYFKSDFDVSNSGFNATLDMSSFPSGKYELAIHLTNKETGKEGLNMTGKTVEKQ